MWNQRLALERNKCSRKRDSCMLQLWHTTEFHWHIRMHHKMPQPVTKQDNATLTKLSSITTSSSETSLSLQTVASRMTTRRHRSANGGCYHCEAIRSIQGCFMARVWIHMFWAIFQLTTTDNPRKLLSTRPLLSKTSQICINLVDIPELD